MFDDIYLNMNCKEICRLCGSENGMHIDIFDGTSECLSKIEFAVPDVVILQHDSLTKLVCHRCVAKVKDFCAFKETCIQTQIMLKQRLPWMSSSLKNGRNASFQRPVSPVIKYLGGALAHPFGDPEPEVEVLTLSDDEDSCGTSIPTSVTPVVNASSSSGQSRKVTHSRGTPSKRPRKRESTSTNAIPPGSSPSKTQHNFQSYLEFQHQLGAIPKLPSVPSHTSADGGISQPAPRTCLQTPGSEGSVKKPNQEKRISLPFPRRQQTPSMSSPTTAADTQLNPTLQEASTNIGNKAPFQTFRPMPAAVPISVSKSVKESSYKTFSLPCMPPAVPLNHPVPVQQPCNKTVNSDVTSSYVKSLNSSAVNSCVKNVKNPKKIPAVKPMPKSKKKIHMTLSEADRNRICQMYPKIEPLKICENTVIFTCSGCNKILMTESAISEHECSSVGRTDNIEPEKDEKNVFGAQNEESYHSSSSSVELICSDDEVINSTIDINHKCGMCGKQFLNLARLQKHEVTHASSEVFC